MRSSDLLAITPHVAAYLDRVNGCCPRCSPAVDAPTLTQAQRLILDDAIADIEAIRDAAEAVRRASGTRHGIHLSERAKRRG